MQEEKKFHPIYLLAGIYVFVVYAIPIIFFFAISEDDSASPLLFLYIPIVLGIGNLIVVCTQKNKIGRERLLHCAILIKYLLIPFYLCGGMLIVVLFLLIFTPLVFMAFMSPFVIMVLSILGWLFMVGAAPFSMGYIIESRKNGIHGKVLSFVACVLQFFFTADVISVMILALKEKKCVKTTLVTISILILGFIGSILGLLALILSLAAT